MTQNGDCISLAAIDCWRKALAQKSVSSFWSLNQGWKRYSHQNAK